MGAARARGPRLRNRATASTQGAVPARSDSLASYTLSTGAGRCSEPNPRAPTRPRGLPITAPHPQSSSGTHRRKSPRHTDCPSPPDDAHRTPTPTALPPRPLLTSIPLLLIPHPDARPTPLCRRPASGLPLSRLGCPARFFLQVEEGGSSAKRWTPLPRMPRRDAKSGPEAGRRPVHLLRRTPRNEHRETNTKSRTHMTWGRARPLRRALRQTAHSDAAACPVLVARSVGRSPS
jgi:hypothetical protein